MQYDKAKLLMKPEGVRDLLPELAEPQRETNGMIMSLFRRWGYLEVVTPALEFDSIFSDGLNSSYDDRMYRFFDARGQTLVLRPDWTMPLARVVASHMKKATRPLRLSYSGSIFRFTLPQQGKPREIFQVGAELLGSASPAADSEIIALAAESLLVAGLKEIKICLGHGKLLTELLNVLLPEDADSSSAIKEYFNNKDLVSLHNFVDTLPLNTEEKKMILRLPELKGGEEVLQKAQALFPADCNFFPLEQLGRVFQELRLFDLEKHIAFDLGLVRGLEYYTGVVFECYTPDLGFPLSGGGRYDHLLEHFGLPLPAVGFAINLDNLMTVLTRRNLVKTPDLEILVAYAGGCRQKAVEEAAKLRRMGLATILDLKERDFPGALDYTSKKKIKSLHYIGEDGIRKEDTL